MTLAKLNTIATGSIASVNGVASASIASINGITFQAVISDAHVLIATATASASATLSFTTGIDSTYDVYEWRYENMHPASSNVAFSFQVNQSGQTGFNEIITSSFFEAHHNEADSATSLSYEAGEDQAQGTAYQPLMGQVGIDNDQSASGVLRLYDPSSTTFTKLFDATANGSHEADYSTENFVGGYINTTGAIDEISFKFSTGNIDSGVVKMYGVKTS